MYPDGFATRIEPEGPAKAGLEDAFRPHFFGGVATVVAKLLQQVTPHFAIFGEKDFQQLKVVTTMARDLDMPVTIVGAPTVREKDGLAMSSRNAYLSASERAVAPTLHQVLKECASRIKDGQPIGAALADGRARIERAGFTVDYLEARNARDAGADRRAQGRPGAAAGGREARPHAPDRQHQGLEQPELAQLTAQRLGHVGRAARDAAQIGRRILGIEIAPALECAIRPRPHRHAFGIEHQPAAADAVLIDERADVEDALPAE